MFQIVKDIIYIILILNIIGAIYTVFRQRRDIAATWAWLLVLSFLPVVGFIIYAFVGRKLPENKLFPLKSKTRLELDQVMEHQRRELKAADFTAADQVVKESERMVQFFTKTDYSFLNRRNEVQIITDGKELFDDIFTEIKKAKKHIHVEFYTIYNDQIGNQLRELLEKKAREGVEVKVLWDSWGSLGTKRSFFKKLNELGGEAFPFLGTRSALTDFRLNFRDHRKIVVIDGKIGYVGGFNVGDQYLGRKKKFGYWRDTHLKIVGSGVYGLQSRFILDWNATDRNHQIVEEFKPGSVYFPVAEVKGNTSLQIVSNGPDSDIEKIKMGYLKMIHKAKESIWIQSPYLIPDDSVLDALRLAASSGVDVRIMIPCMPDHAFVYRATQYYAWQCAKWGIKVYYYNNGFLHAKTMVIDGKISTVGSANMDFRSFKLNFEVNAFMYDENIAKQLQDIYEEDMKQSSLQTVAMFNKQSTWLKFKQTFSRLLSPIL
jgi:cardiolipin synthase